MTSRVSWSTLLRRWLVRLVEWLFLWALLMGIVGVFQATHDHFRARCEAMRYQIHDGYEVPGCHWNYDPSDVVMNAKPLTSRYQAIDEMLALR